MMNRFRSIKTAKRQEGYALVAALLILLLMTAYGLWAMLTSTSESKLSGNMTEEQLMFFFAQQGTERILSHLHYLDQGLFSRVMGLGYIFQDTSSSVLDAIEVLDTKQTLHFTGSSTWGENPLFRITANIDPRDYSHGNERNVSPPLAIRSVVENSYTGFTRTFEAIVQPKSIWDFAYFSQNHNPVVRENYGSCNTNPNSWYNCHTVFHGARSYTFESTTEMRGPDTVIGDIYLSNSAVSPDNSRLYMRGAPHFNGEVRWRNVEGMDLGSYGGGSFSNSDNQTNGGTGISTQPTSRKGMVPHSGVVEMFDMDFLTSFNPPYYRKNADLRLTNAGTGYIWKIIFRNDIAPNYAADGCREEGRVASAITPDINNGQVDCTHANAQGTFLLYRVPYSTAAERVCALYGDTMYKRHVELTGAGSRTYEACQASGTAELWNPSVGWNSRLKGAGCYGVRNNISGSPTMGPYDPNDVPGTYYFFYVPSQGKSMSATCLGGSGGTYNGIINVEGDVLVEGIVDGKVTIVANGDIIISHEIEYEESPSSNVDSTSHSSVDDIDMLGLFATGNIRIPNSRPKALTHSWRGVYDDDWSDAEYGDKAFVPTAKYDTVPLTDDNGTEDIHAVMISYGYGACSGTAGGLSCPTAPIASDIRNFFVGLYATPRTDTGLPNGDPCCFEGGSWTWNDMGNDSGTLRIVGAVIQDYPGRVGYDFDNGGSHWANSSCTDGGAGGGCNFIGHRLELIYDKHLNFTAPAMPGARSTSRYIPYGRASYDIVSWRELNASAVSGNQW